MRNKKKEIIIFVIIFIISLIIFQNFLNGHYASDTYTIYNMGYVEYGTNIFLKAGRPFSCLLLMAAEFIKLSIEGLVLVSTIIGIIISCLSVMLIRKIIISFKTPKNTLEDIIVVMISYCTIYNFMYIEMLYFAETAIMTLGVYTAILAAYQLFNAKKYRIIKSFLLILVAIFSYNGTAGVYIVTVILLSLLYNKKVKENLSTISLAVVLLIVSIALNFLQIKIATIYFNTMQNRISLNIFNNIRYILLNVGNVLLGKTNHLFPKGVFLIFLITVIGTCIWNLKKENKVIIIKIIIFTFFGMFSSFAMHIFSLSSFGAGRIHVSVGMTVGYLIAMIYTLTDIFYSKKRAKYFIEFILVTYLLVNIVNLYTLTKEHLIVNNFDKERTQEISNYIKNYEEENEIEVKYIAMVYLGFNENAYYKKINGINGYALYSEWAFDSVINFYTDKKLEKINLTLDLYEKYMERFEDYKVVCIDNILLCPVYIV